MSDQATEKDNELRLTILLRRSGSAWIAQCLEYDVAAQGPTPEVCKQRFMNTMSSRILRDLAQGRVPLADLTQAPKRYFEESLLFRADGPELPVYVPVKPSPRLRATARFLGARDQAPGAQA